MMTGYRMNVSNVIQSVLPVIKIQITAPHARIQIIEYLKIQRKIVSAVMVIITMGMLRARNVIQNVILALDQLKMIALPVILPSYAL
jgi:hypothetical protein